jgi:hypothetical protein
MPKRVGLDFDGCIADTHQAKSDLIFEMFGVRIPIEKCRRKKLVLEDDPQLLEHYRYAQKLIYEERYYSNRVCPMPGCIRRLKQLAVETDREGKQKYEFYVLSSRSPEAARLAMSWLEGHGILELGVQFVGVGREGGKDRAARQRRLDMYFDDDLHKLVQISANVSPPPQLFLFEQAHNRGIVAPDGIQPVNSWDNVCKRISGTRFKAVG